MKLQVCPNTVRGTVADFEQARGAGSARSWVDLCVSAGPGVLAVIAEVSGVCPHRV
jgi:hypothetical protein